MTALAVVEGTPPPCTAPPHPQPAAPPRTPHTHTHTLPSTLQLLRGLATGMKAGEFSSARQWRPFAQEAQKQLRGVALPASLSAHVRAL